MTSNSNNSSSRIMTPAGTYHSDKFEYVNQKLREHVQLAANDEIPSAIIVEDQQRNVDDRMRYFIDFYLGTNLIKPSPYKINI
jgi:hypothetical protein